MKTLELEETAVASFAASGGSGFRPYYKDASVTIYHGDAIELLPQIRGDVLLTSPPYGVQGNNMAERHKNKYDGAADTLTRNLMDALANANCKWRFVNVQTLSANKSLIWKWVGANADRLKDVIIWAKDNPPPSMEPGVMDCAFEFIFCIADDDAWKRKFDGMEWRGTVKNLIRSTVSTNEWAKYHRAAFPEWLPSWVVSNFSKPGETIVDGCAGIGTTLRAAKDHGRLAIGVELNEKYCEIAAKRMAQECLMLGSQNDQAHRLAGRNLNLKPRLYDYTKRKQHAGGEFGAAHG